MRKNSLSSIEHQNKILVIDDEPIIIESISYDLMNEGYEILTALNGREGLVLFKKEKPILIILDIRMPVMDGVEFLEYMKLEPSDPYAVIVLTGHGDDEEVQKCFNLGVSSFLKKPYNIHVLKGMVMHSIKLKQAQQELQWSELKYRSLVRTATYAIISADSNGRIISWNKGAQEMFGYNEVEIQDKPLTVLMPERYRDAHKKGFKRVKLTGESNILGKTIELYGLRKDGIEFPLELSSSALLLGMLFKGILNAVICKTALPG